MPSRRDGFALVRMHSATINQLANSLRTGGFGAPPVPLVMGNEGAGTVEESSRFPAGTRVAVYGHGDIGVTVDGLYQQWVRVPEHRLLELPDALTFGEGAALTVNYLTAYLALTQVAHLEKGQTVLVSGATGGVGGAVMQTSRALGTRAIAVVSTPAKARHAARAGAHAVIDLSSQNLNQAVAELTDGRGVDLAMDPVGGPRLGELLRSVRRHGTFVSLGFTGGKQAEIDVVDLIVGEKHVTAYGLHGDSEDNTAKGLEALGRLAAEGQLHPTIDSTFALDDFEQGFARLTSREAVGSIVLEL
ncbi:quinone oxidoreductase family protein [Streptomyces shenzhenensis]|uniref:quinone oxidoreductase family protein n=1 Tax=Streptomyces shenzhenensis TaxID=943815 RepID=UPI0033DB20A7